MDELSLLVIIILLLAVVCGFLFASYGEPW